MAANALVRARVDEALKDEAASVLATMGLTVSDLIRITLTKVAREKMLPFEMHSPNRLTVETFVKSECGEDVHYAESADAMFKDLGI
ncbi:type II toxin-antitoxin system RelB/DinJ family antitoxin [Xylella taiwanensis]|uniref:Antitoxin n=2 Tax=Xylella taiwanensis TaxID=1444770 RepID=Z9JHR3_9GAMM|nr:type II toxin-antitoxin system RelB/DinJ family antitoxin [Xylella taiwanensis]AXI83581.1 antitoxin DinJ [Xylella taiwanensis]EWS77302.1 antitoxin [Xylella taiwanensis]MCD8456660.1 type II toxin-antitoxin system RelB/DinJ family antitoxin [Xylella taiwanensis]MCD8459067.1 type II toxin-antitoxin system RelB/DinJ family antitoxin [Xylella taiwanensis]MCD8462040.1 type II toxin-antitoxin system RelB/DinJ family antitoxin [Xylella taiwanensis]